MARIKAAFFILAISLFVYSNAGAQDAGSGARCRSLFDESSRLSRAGEMKTGAAAARIDRETNLARLHSEEFDVLIIGGGSAGLGAAVDAASRGLKVAIVEANDFAAETSSRSTKLLHGGVRYLEQLAMTLMTKFKFDKVLYNLIRDALHERGTVLKIAPHLSKPLPIVTPVYKAYEVPYYMTGLKIYDALAGKKSGLPPSRFVGAEELKRDFPLMKSDGLKGGVLYYDGQFNDSRMAVTLAMTAQELGVAVVNHAGVTSLLKMNGVVNGAVVKDALAGGSVKVRAKAVINATGPFSDRIRKMDDPNAKPMIAGAAGTHIVLSPKFVPPETGMLIPKTDDGRVLFVLPWEGHTLVGTTDSRSDIRENPRATEEDIEYILKQVAKYYEAPPTRADVLSQWTGIRPLISDPNSADTAKLARDHVVQISESKLVTIAGGKWTTYRKMALDVVDQVIRVAGLKPRHAESQTENLILVGGRGYSEKLASRLTLHYRIDAELATYLVHGYGDRASEVLATGVESGLTRRLVKGHPFIEAEVLHAARVESARTAVDVIARRMRLAFLDHAAALKALPRVVDILGDEFGWSPDRRAYEIQSATDYLSVR
jgi:glycerol-3-phosphate dehydrogenase